MRFQSKWLYLFMNQQVRHITAPKINLESISKNAPMIFHRLRWSNGIACPCCGSIHIYNPDAGKLHICADCAYRFTDTSNTIFHSTKLPLSKWLYAIYFFVETTRGLSSYALARLINVSQTTAWTMLKKIRTAIKHDIQIPNGAILDEVYIGADWKRLPAFKKYQRATPPNPVWNLHGNDLKRYYKSEFMRLASEDKMPVLGISDPFKRSLVLLSIPSSDRKEFIRSEINRYCEDSIINPSDNPTVLITDNAKCYTCISEITNVNGNQVFQHEVCRHDINKYSSPNGYSSNRLEASFAHLKRMWRGTYQRWSRKYNQSYLNEFAWKYTHGAKSLNEKLTMLFDWFCPAI